MLRPWPCNVSAVLAVLLLVRAALCARGDGGAPDRLLNAHAMIMAHDSGSGYLGNHSGLIDLWTDTQGGTVVEQLACGARAIDARLKVERDNVLEWHHGVVTTGHSFEESVIAILEWINANPEELVVMGISHCKGKGCIAQAQAVLKRHGATPVVNCSELRGMTVSKAKIRGAVSGQRGSLLVLSPSDGLSCSVNNWDPTLTCFGFRKHHGTNVTEYGDASRPITTVLAHAGVDPTASTELLTFDELAAVVASTELYAAVHGRTHSNLSPFYSCYVSSDTEFIPLDRLMQSLDKVAAKSPAANGTLSQMQGLWQSNVVDVVIGTLKKSSLLIEARESQINLKLADAVRNGRWKHINLLEVNDVCGPGRRELVDAVQKYNLQE